MNHLRPIAIVTGSGTGVGAAIAHKLADSGWNLVVNYTRSIDAARQTAEELQGRGAEVLLVQADIAIDADCRRLAAEAEDKWGRIDGLVNNAGVTRFCPAADLDGLEAQDFQRVMGVNVVGTYQMTRACVPALRKSDCGSVLNISSQAGFSGLGSSIAYAASKAAINNMTLALARALAPEIRVNALCPGFVNTRWVKGGMDDATYERFQKHINEMTPLGRMTEAEEVAETAHFLLTTRAPITGELLGIDGGNHLTVNAPNFEP
ncbi:3-oxoacyl-[acyl-carrier protein] reductase [Microbulbifer donghaiensis]|uniref:3-oxoacyl-[acyl-carrier protein] reductase n=1 Tax=Microbulbifer donghaiensis TaxID=494016 RepID=A0A1M4UJQ0_9GAMM|nr:SDR family oxidoreductase [Microbulbifer donghaiensis]SHE56783.1 3-oxoacyl-[acyl-carrier protein] reductase [Microbulbifer donghaiensis]